ncbi:MAG: hypothetical protein A2513_07005 [Sulfurimonas sp. RIFOXYD12_FULL_33_39]|uniref:hypothetical protein n=1 Tax=unclassified Sulfurimonas TaxID=2623549 RepID=UPI0008D1EF6B|nr:MULTISPECIES: hypothetical protein [unclassified Sulfurimonas]OHE01632.1 MAG: hypothetical protein A3G74_06765 [Sulfurimonas sp. RIFCSPLOWO2_12_FULL_34_6]OHE10600.1 MAG: hypothetical protein A2513_07005 [Sulfurimonas sp. RIFOXYD12_FULL_33_39]OHE15059.1 MAG: hypothetical protein A2530_01195 [Sulfurimonas sp. RIFOXYD2_FULL_34_21]DAB27424.1 MAG TPA: hypothetical protein CFH78_07960 [Sulfurimonas sp. UBA10385]
MSKFFFLLWLKWAVRLTTCSILFAAVFSFFVTIFIYFFQGMANLNDEVRSALFDIFKFWFMIFWALSLILAHFRGLKYIFNRCINGYELKLLTCKDDEAVEVIGYGDLPKLWRRWLMLNVWFVGSFMIFALIYTTIFTSYNGVFEWFNIFWLYGFILLSGYFSLITIGLKYKKIKIASC